MMKRFSTLFAGHPVECWQHAVGAINRLPRRLADAAPMVVPFWLLDLDFVGFGKRQAGSSRRGVMSLHEILLDIHTLEEDLLAFERKYGIRSETFYAAYISGEEPDDDSWVLDFGEWASVYRTWLTRQAEYRNEVQRIQRHAPGLAGLIRVTI